MQNLKLKPNPQENGTSKAQIQLWLVNPTKIFQLLRSLSLPFLLFLHFTKAAWQTVVPPPTVRMPTNKIDYNEKLK